MYSYAAADVIKPTDGDEFINKVVRPINAQDGDLLTVSAFKGIEDGTWPAGTAKFNIFDIANHGFGELQMQAFVRTCT